MDDAKYQKTEDPNFVKDTATGALVSNDLIAFKKHKLQQKRVVESKTQKNELNSIKSDVSELKEELCEIKDMLKQLLIR